MRKMSKIEVEGDTTPVNQTGYNVDSSHFRELNKSSKQLEKEYDENIKIKKAQCSAFEIQFAERYVASGNAGESARLAGSRAEKLHIVGANTLKRPHVREYIDALMMKATMRATLKAGDVLDMIRRVYDAAMEAGNLKEANVAANNLAAAMGLNKAGGSVDKTGPTSKEKEQDDRKAELLEKIRSASNPEVPALKNM